jgi:hypothetical protein
LGWLTATQPWAESQSDSVHGSVEEHTTAVPPKQLPAMHRSLAVQALPSSQGPVLFTFVHPATASQVSSVQGFESSQGLGSPPQFALWQESPTVHPSPSSQDVPFGAPAASQAPVVGSH